MWGLYKKRHPLQSPARDGGAALPLKIVQTDHKHIQNDINIKNKANRVSRTFCLPKVPIFLHQSHPFWPTKTLDIFNKNPKVT